MDFIERWLGVSPDGGSGALEVMIVLCLAAAALAFVYRRRIWAVAKRWVGPGSDA
jgi:hypothetical protein